MTRLAIVLAMLTALIAGAGADAHTRSESHGAWRIDGRSVHLSFAMSDGEAQRIVPSASRPSDAALIRYLAANEKATAGDRPCRTAVPPRATVAAAGYRRIAFSFHCPSAEGIVLHSDAFFDLVPTHVTIAQIRTGADGFAEQLFDRDHRSIAIDNGGALEGAGFLAFVRMGIAHIFTGIDHMSFLVGLVLISRRLRDLAFVVTGFTLGHSMTLALAVTGIVRPHAEFIDALVALTIALIGIENIAIATRRPGLLALWTGGVLAAMFALRLAGVGLLPPLLLLGAGLFSANYLMISGHVRDAGRLRLMVTLVFGLIHGFGFAADLLSDPMPPARLAELLVGFNLGVEIGQLSLVLALSGTIWGLQRHRLTLPRPIVVDVCASLLVGLGMFWFVGRSFAI